VLVCDDELQILRALKVILREAGFEVIAAADGAAGKEIRKEQAHTAMLSRVP